MRELFLGGLRFAVAYPQYAELSKRLLASGNKRIYAEYMAERMPVATEFFQPLLQRAIRGGEVRADVDVKMAAHLIAWLSVQVVEYYIEHVAPDYDERMLPTVEQFIAFLRSGIGAQSDAGEATQ